MKEALCKAFCSDLNLVEVPVGYAVATAFLRDDGDHVSFYIVRDEVLPGKFRIEDGGDTVPDLEARGVDFSTGTRRTAFAQLLESHGAEFNEDEMLLQTQAMTEDELPQAAMRFVALMLRMSDFLLLTQEKVASTFKEDAAKAILNRIGDRAKVAIDEPVSSDLSDTVPDLLIKADQRPAVAVFFGTSSQRVNDAIFLQMQALYEAGSDVQVISLLEKESVIGQDLRKRAMNRLAAMPIYRGDEAVAISRIEREVFGRPQAVLH
ncbi:DUF1828 domain-containing protein [Novosphingobium sp. fls2-241-R2A-195]|uniref:DUF1828 domain-containing protein n=1 Tax=Novosphingobium sp. fls2-241-R2A-195 TaxID=3040296 RepID=UPI00254C538A|nr:DUF1828 domain-containing protein [Novosphingobium sp. fls2-241-R2A-195]